MSISAIRTMTVCVFVASGLFALSPAFAQVRKASPAKRTRQTTTTKSQAITLGFDDFKSGGQGASYSSDSSAREESYAVPSYGAEPGPQDSVGATSGSRAVLRAGRPAQAAQPPAPEVPDSRDLPGRGGYRDSGNGSRVYDDGTMIDAQGYVTAINGQPAPEGVKLDQLRLYMKSHNGSTVRESMNALRQK